MTSPMRIAYLCANYLNRRGGAELHAHRLAEELARLGHAVTMIAAVGPLEPYPGAPYRTVALRRDRRREERARRWLALEHVRGGYRLAQWLLRGGTQRLLALGPCCPELEDPRLCANYDVVALIHGGNAWPVQLAPVMRRLPGPLTVAMPLLHVREEIATYAALRRIYSGYRLIVTNSEYESAWMARRGWGAERLFAVGVGSDDVRPPAESGAFRNRHGIPPDAPLVVFVGRKIFNKGVQHLIEAMDRVWDRHPQARLALLGFAHNDPGWIPGLISRLRHPAEGRILNLDDVGEREREEALEDGDVFCMPSISDSFGIAYLDAWRHRRPVIGCRDCSSETVIDPHRTGLLVEFGDIAELAAALNSLLADPGMRARMGEAGFREWQGKWTWERIARRTETIFADHLPPRARC